MITGNSLVTKFNQSKSDYESYFDLIVNGNYLKKKVN